MRLLTEGAGRNFCRALLTLSQNLVFVIFIVTSFSSCREIRSQAKSQEIVRIVELKRPTLARNKRKQAIDNRVISTFYNLI